ncbi:MAG: hemolysin III family protein [Clostridia bacterium]|nr:hemolysin III family protein [Clostridia bacterium]
MKRQKLDERELPEYTRGEEIFNMVSHIVGGAAGIAAVSLCVIFAAIHKNVYGVIGSSIYGAAMIILYTCSSIYHGLSPKRKAKKVFQIIDHCSIFILIAGTYTPICLTALREFDARLGWWLFGIVWGVAFLGITLNAIDLRRYRVFSMICYIAMGWCILCAYRAYSFLAERGGMWLLLWGGIAYTVGVIFYGLQKKYKYMHSVFHLFVVAGSVLQMLYILLYIV